MTSSLRSMLTPVLWFACILTLLTIASILFNSKASAYNPDAISNQAPMENSMDIVRGRDAGQSLAPYFIVGVSGPDGYDGNVSWAKVYVPNGQPARLTVQYGGGHCARDDSIPSDVTYEMYDLTNRDDFTISQPGEAFGLPYRETKDNSDMGGVCDDSSFYFDIPANAGITSTITGHTGYRVFGFRATLNNVWPGGSGSITKTYRLRVNNGGLVGFSRPITALEQNTVFGVFNNEFQRQGRGGNWNYNVQFAPRCGENDPNSNLTIYDADWATARFQPDLSFEVRGERNVAPVDPAGSWPRRFLLVERNDFNPGSKVLQSFTYEANDAYKYRLNWSDIAYNNAVQTRIVFDQFDAQRIIECAVVPPPPPAVVTETRPYIKAYGAHVVTGGWFDDGDVSCGGNSNYKEASQTSVGNNPYPGGIRTFGVVERSGATFNAFGSVSKYGSRSLGLVEGSGFLPSGATVADHRSITGSGYGFFTNQLHPTPSTDPPPALARYYSPTYLTLANGSPPSTSTHYPPSTDYPSVGAKYAGGILGGVDAAVSDQCIPDFYGTTQGNPAVLSALNPVTNLAALASTQQIIAPGAGQNAQIGTGAQLAIVAGQRLTIYVEGDVYIGSNIVYTPGYDYSEPEEVPYFSLIVRGNIYVGKNVDRLEGFYVAQPDTSSQAAIDATGNFVTCAERSPASAPPSAVSYAQLGNECNNRLLVNGAVAAKRAVLLRSNGSIERALPNEDFTQGVTYPANAGGRTPNNSFSGGTFRQGDTAAEVFNYIPEMMIATPNFAGGGDLLNRFEVERIYSLPPVF